MYISEALQSKGNVTLRGWIAELRDLNKIKFIVLRDKTGKAQILLKNAEKDLIETFSKLTKEDYIEVSGSFVENPQAMNGKELIPNSIKIISKSEQPFPIDLSEKIETALDKRIDWRFLDMRRPKSLAVFQLQSQIVKAIVDFLHKEGFTRIFSSKIIDFPTEGGTEYFEIKYFDKKAYLAQSPQFYKELALLSGLDKVYEIGPVYRAEPHHTPRHLCEYTSIDFEMVANSMEEIMSTEENLLRYLFKQINKNCKPILKLYNIRELEFPKKIPRVHFKDAVKIVEDMGIKTEPGDLTSAGERALGEWAKKEHKSDFVFLTHFPWKYKVFYAKKSGEDAQSFDLLYKGLEITTGGLREENAEQRAKNALEKGIDPKQFDHLRFFKYGMPPHGGLAIGLERLTCQILNLENVREASLTPRDPTRITP